MPEKNFKTLLPHIKLMVFDVDGVLSDGSIHCFNDGEQLRVLNIKDGYALQLAIKKETFDIKLVRLNENNFLQTLRSKLSWGLDKRN
jgi:3-deoxy-D-manno-octulosonate 8-phosphate phosphatase KdsC-like HAD superfamily phosphatase